MKAYERLLNYVKVPTPSDERSGTHPSSACQRVLAEQLVKEMKKLGVSDVRIDEKCYVYGKIPATKGYESKTKLGFIAHMDTVSDFADHAVNPVVHENYDGKDLKLSESGRTLETAVFPHLASLAGKTLITSDGTTVLGADAVSYTHLDVYKRQPGSDFLKASGNQQGNPSGCLLRRKHQVDTD